MSTIPTLYEFIDELELLDAEYPGLSERIANKAVKFAKLHVEAALKAASSSASFAYNGARGKVHTIVYPLENIK